MKENHLMCEKLNNLHIKTLHYQNSLGTDLTIHMDPVDNKNPMTKEYLKI